MNKYFIFFILLLQEISFAFSSSLPRLVTFDDYLNAIYQRQNFTEEQDFESIKEILQEAYARPLNLNKVTAESLAALAILSNEQIKNYFHHLATTGPLYSKYELQAIPSFDLTTIALLLPFVYVMESYDVPSNYPKIYTMGYNYFLFRYVPFFTQLDGVQVATLGSLDSYTLQLACNHLNDVTWGITARKQAGESFRWDHTTYRYGFNLWSIFLMVNNKKLIKRIIIGDYQIGHGQGLLLSAGYIQVGDSITSIIRSNNVGIIPYKGIRRIGLRGVAITSDLGAVELTGFYGNNHLDGSIQFDKHNKPYTKRVDATGKYNTMHQLEKKGTINEQVLGCTIRKQYHRNQTEVGINLLYNHYDIPIISQQAPDLSYLFQAQSAASLFYRFLWKNWIFFGEGGFILPHAIECNNDKGLITGSIISLSRYIDLSLALYYYGKRFYTPYGRPFKHYTTDYANEKGVYIGWMVTLLSSWQVAINGHFFATLSSKPKLGRAGNGHRLITRSSYRLNPKTIWTVQYTFDKNLKNKPKKATNRDEPTIALATKNSFKSKIAHQFTHYWWANIEAQYSHYKFLEQVYYGYGFANTQKWKRGKWHLACKSIYFKTQNYTTRLYFYLPNPLYMGRQFYPYYGDGFAMTWLICWKPIDLIRLEIRYSLIYYFDNLSKEEKTKANRSYGTKYDGTIQILVSW